MHADPRQKPNAIKFSIAFGLTESSNKLVQARSAELKREHQCEAISRERLHLTIFLAHLVRTHFNPDVDAHTDKTE